MGKETTLKFKTINAAFHCAVQRQRGESEAFLGGQRWQVGMSIKRRRDIEG